jgi:hypothetical protein
MLNRTPKIVLKDFLSKDLSLRDLNKDLFNKINKVSSKEIILDFSDVLSMSRSFAQEYVLRKKSSKVKIIEKNQSKDVKSMLKVIQLNAPKTNFKFKTISLNL